MNKTSMNKTSMIHIRVQPDVKAQVEEILNNLGMTTTEAVNIYLKQIILNCGLPFAIRTPKFSNDLLEAIEEAEEMEKHPDNYKKFHSVKELMEDLESE